MKYQVKSEEQFEQEAAEEAKKSLLPEGTYDFEIFDGEEKTSAKGNDMWVLTLNVFDETGAGRKITDYLVSGTNYGERKIRHAAASCGLVSEYEAQKLVVEDFTGK